MAPTHFSLPSASAKAPGFSHGDEAPQLARVDISHKRWYNFARKDVQQAGVFLNEFGLSWLQWQMVRAMLTQPCWRVPSEQRPAHEASMLIREYKLRTNQVQEQAIDEAIRTVQFIRNKCVRLVRRVNGDPESGQKTGEVENTTFRTDALSKEETQRGV